MTVVVITPPSAVVTLEEAKRHLIVDHDDDDVLIETLVEAATGWLDGPSGWLGRALGIQVLEWRGCGWPCLPLPYPPFVEIVSASYVDPDGAAQTWDVPDPLNFDEAPAVRGGADDVKVRYRAGYGALSDGETPEWTNAVPAAIRVAIMMIVADWYRNRETFVAGASVEKIPFGAETLLSTFRVYR